MLSNEEQSTETNFIQNGLWKCRLWLIWKRRSSECKEQFMDNLNYSGKLQLYGFERGKGDLIWLIYIYKTIFITTRKGN